MMQESSFSLGTIAQGSCVLVFGARNVGKTTLVERVIRAQGYSDETHAGCVMVYDHTRNVNEWARAFPHCSVTAGYDPRVLERLMTQQNSYPPQPMFVVMDDLFHRLRDYQKCPVLRRFLYRHRQLNISVCIIMQPPVYGIMTDYVFYFPGRPSDIARFERYYGPLHDDSPYTIQSLPRYSAWVVGKDRNFLLYHGAVDVVETK